MQGSYYKRGSTWSFTINLGKDLSTGKRKQKTKGGFKTKKEAQVAARELINDVSNGTYKDSDNQLFDDFFQKWLVLKYKRKVQVTTFKSKQYIVKNHILPYFKSKPLNQISSWDIDTLYELKLDAGLSPKYIRDFHFMLNQCFDQALADNLIRVNPVKKAVPPAIEQKEMQTWNKEQVKKFLLIAEKYNYLIPFLLAIFTGMRRGEVLGLKWSDINLQTGKIAVKRSLVYLVGEGLVFRQTKTKKSNRLISISSYVIAELRKHFFLQHQIKAHLGSIYKDHDLVICTEDGKPLDPNNLLRTLNRLVEEAKIPKIRFHDLRHTHATLMLENNIHPKIVAERLGHSRVGITLDTYSHVNPNMQDDAAETFEKSYFNNPK